MNIGLFVVLSLIFILPLLFKKVEDNLEVFLFIMGNIAIVISKSMTAEFILEILRNKFLYMITAAVLIGGFLFRYINKYIKKLVENILKKVSLRLFIFMLIIIIGLLSSVITAIIASLLLVEIIEMLPVARKDKVKINIISCFSIGLGSALTPIGEPLATIIVTKLHVGFWYLTLQLGRYIIPSIILLAVLGEIFGNKHIDFDDDMKLKIEKESNFEIILKAIKIFMFVIALDMLGAGFKPIVEEYVIKLDSSILYWINISSAVLDNATLASAEISSKMTVSQINAVLMGLLISGGMMVPGNIPNIISSGKLRIKSKEWMKFGIPLGMGILVIFYIVLFI